MGWDIKGWLFGRPKDNSKKVIKELRNDRNDLRDQLKEQQKQAQKLQEQYSAQTAALTQGIQQLQISQQQQADQFKAQADAYQAQNEGLNALLIQQKEASAQAAAQAAAALAQARADAAEQRRIATNLGNAYVPDAMAGAAAPSSSEGSLDGKRKRKDNELSELSIVSDASANPMAKAGLQIA